MPTTLAQAMLNAQTDLVYAVISNLRRSSWLLDQIVFDDVATPGTGGASLQYGYHRLITPASAGFRAFNEEYTPGQATRQRFTVDLKPLGGSFTVDKKLANLGPAQTNEVTFQMQHLLTSIRVRFCEEVIRGDVAVDAKGFDGLSKSLVGSTTEMTATVPDWTAATVITQALAMARLDEVDEWLSRIVPSQVGGGDLGVVGGLPPGVRAILGNTKSITRFRALVRWAGLATEEKDDLGRRITRYGEWVLVDIGDRQDGASPIIPIATPAGTTDLYAVTFGLDSFHGASMAGVPLVEALPPDFSTPGRVKSGDAEMGPVAVCLKNTKAAAVLRGIKVQ